MQPQNPLSRHPKTLSKIKDLIAYRKMSVQEDVPVNLDSNSRRSTRQELKRRCNDNRPSYPVDNVLDEEEEKEERINIFRASTIVQGLASTPSTVMERRPYRGTLDNTITRQEDNNALKYLTISSWLIDMNVVKEDTVMSCFDGINEMMLTFRMGKIKRKGIHCFCCQQVFPESEFLRHILGYTVDKPYHYILVHGMGVSLLTCQIEAWNRHSVPERNGYYHVVKKPRVLDHSDDSCLICADGGDLMCCDKCPSTYHPKCIGFEDVPQDDWHCPFCHCRYCDHDSSTELLLTCFQCSKKYHWRCSEMNDRLLQPSRIPFCGAGCWQVYWNLEAMVGKTMRTCSIGREYWVLVRRMDLDPLSQQNADFHTRVVCNTMVGLAAELLEDSFRLIIDRQTKTNMVQSVVYSCGSNFRRISFSRFYTAVLVANGNIVTVASLRIPSPDIAEIPFIATADGWRNRGFRKRLYDSLETVLASMGVEHILIPSSEEMVTNWQTSCGFSPLNEPMKRRIRTLNTLMFPKTTRLQKDIRVERGMKINDLNLPPPEAEYFYPGYDASYRMI